MNMVSVLVLDLMSTDQDYEQGSSLLGIVSIDQASDEVFIIHPMVMCRQTKPTHGALRLPLR
jgi:hypothetical protein